jgi:uncharacterized protein (TIGR02996 family)
VKVARGFRYFELVDEAAGKFAFWEISLDGPIIEQRHGPVGTAGKAELETCSSVEHARREYELRVEAKLDAGYRECADRRLDARTLALQQAIDSDPDDTGAYMVYADWIQTLGDLRGSLIVAQIAAAENQPGAAARAEAFLGQHAAEFLGPLAEHVGYDGAILEPTWRHGFIRRARIAVREWSRSERVLDALLAHPSARWLDALVLETVDDFASLQPVVDVLQTAPRPRIRELTLRDAGEVSEEELDEAGNYVWRRPQVDLAKLWQVVPRLRQLVIHGVPKRLGILGCPELEHLELHAPQIDLAALALGGACPAVTRLELRYRWPHGPEILDRLSRVLDGPLGRRPRDHGPRRDGRRRRGDRTHPQAVAARARSLRRRAG